MIAGGATLLATGALGTATETAGMGTHAFGLSLAEAAAFIAPGLDGARAAGVTAAYVFLQSVHYAVWLLLLPQGDRAGRGGSSFRAAARAWRADLGGGGGFHHRRTLRHHGLRRPRGDAAATFGLLRQEDPHNGVQTTDTVYLSTDTITGTGDTATGFTVNLSSASPAHTASLAITAPTGAPIAAGTYSSVDTTPTTDKPGVVLTVDGSACAPTTKLGKLTITQLHFTAHRRRRPEPHVGGVLPHA